MFAAIFEKKQYCRAPKLRTHDKEHCAGPNNIAVHVTPRPSPNIKRPQRSGPLISRSDGWKQIKHIYNTETLPLILAHPPLSSLHPACPFSLPQHRRPLSTHAGRRRAFHPSAPPRRPLHPLLPPRRPAAPFFTTSLSHSGGGRLAARIQDGLAPGSFKTARHPMDAAWRRGSGAGAQSPSCGADPGRRHASEAAAHPRLWRSC
jgi:hypothetical protein